MTCPKDVAVRAGRGLSSARVRWTRADFHIHSNHRIKYDSLMLTFFDKFVCFSLKFHVDAVSVARARSIYDKLYSL